VLKQMQQINYDTALTMQIKTNKKEHKIKIEHNVSTRHSTCTILITKIMTEKLGEHFKHFQTQEKYSTTKRIIKGRMYKMG
jgi:hypothetical protein